jgi:hypothetical protein
MPSKQAIWVIGLALIVSACGSGGGGSPSGATPTTTTESQSGNLKLAKTKADISCTAASKDFLFYVTGDGKFYLCDGSALTEIDLKGKDGQNGKDGADGDDGMDIAAIYNLSSAAGDIETRYSNIYQFFTGGQLIKFSNGLRYFSGTFVGVEEYDDTTVGDPDMDTNSYYYTVSAYTKGAAIALNAEKIARTGSDLERRLFLNYDYAADNVEIWYDTDGDEVPEATDLKVETLGKTLVNLN